MLARSAIHAIKALLELASDPSRWRSVNDLAAAQAIPAPMLEQLLLKLRRAGIVEARRGRLGGYRLARSPVAIPLSQVITAVRPMAAAELAEPPEREPPEREPPVGEPPQGVPGERVTAALQRRLNLALERELAGLTLGELLFDLHSAQASLSEERGLLLF